MGCNCAGKEPFIHFLVESVLVASTFVYDLGLEFNVLLELDNPTGNLFYLVKM